MRPPLEKPFVFFFFLLLLLRFSLSTLPLTVRFSRRGCPKDRVPLLFLSNLCSTRQTTKVFS